MAKLSKKTVAKNLDNIYEDIELQLRNIRALYEGGKITEPKAQVIWEDLSKAKLLVTKVAAFL